MINTTKHILCILMMIAALQGCESNDIEDTRGVQTDGQETWTALTDSNVLAAYRNLVKEHPVTNEATTDLAQLGCNIDVANAVIVEASAWAKPRANKVAPTIRVQAPIACATKDGDALPARLTVELGGNVYIDVQRAFVSPSELFELDAHIQNLMWLPGEALETKPGQSGDEPF